MQKIVKNRQQFPGRGTVVIQKFLSHQTLGTAFTHEDDGFYEYAAGILLSGYAILSGDEKIMADFTSENWAYRVDDEDIVTVSPQDESERVRSLFRDYSKSLTTKRSKPTFLTLTRVKGSSGNDPLHLYVPPTRGPRFSFKSFLPKISEDFLLNLSKARPKPQTRLSVEENLESFVQLPTTRKSIAELMNWVHTNRSVTTD